MGQIRRKRGSVDGYKQVNYLIPPKENYSSKKFPAGCMYPLPKDCHKSWHIWN